MYSEHMRPRSAISIGWILACIFAASACDCGGSARNDASVETTDAAADSGLGDAGLADAGEGDAELADAGTGDAGCIPSGTEVCDGVDNDCNGLTDDVDAAHDGIYDCLRIGLFGQPGLRPSSDFLVWLQSNGTTVTRVQTSTSEELTPALLTSFDIVILDRLVRSYTPGEAVVLRDWVASGGGLVVMSGYTGDSSDWTFPNSLLADFELGIGTTLQNGPVTTFLPHPTTEGLTSVTFMGGFNVGVPRGDGGLDIQSDGGLPGVVAALPSGSVGITKEWQKGRVFVWGDEWIEFDSEWRALPQIPRFWANILGWVAHFR